jgi:hypothetical protein
MKCKKVDKNYEKYISSKNNYGGEKNDLNQGRF